MTKLKTIQTRATPEFIEALDKHLAEIKFSGSRADYILGALVEKMASELDNPIPAPKAPHGVRLDSRPSGWLSRLYPDRYELVVLADKTIKHLHEYGKIDFPHSYRRWFDDIKNDYVQANVYVHAQLSSESREFFPDSPIGKLVYRFIEGDDNGTH